MASPNDEMALAEGPSNKEKRGELTGFTVDFAKGGGTLRRNYSGSSSLAGNKPEIFKSPDELASMASDCAAEAGLAAQAQPPPKASKAPAVPPLTPSPGAEMEAGEEGEDDQGAYEAE